MYKIIITAMLIVLVFGCKYEKNKPEKGKRRPNILFIMSDDHAYQAISAYRKGLIETPNIDRLAKEGMIFTNASVTNSICAPSRATLLTGKHCHLHGKIDNLSPFDTTQVTFPQLLQKAGYQTAMFGKLHFGNNPKGFDQFKILLGKGDYYNPDFITKTGNIRINGYVTDIITDLTLEWLDKQCEKNKPFLLFYMHKAPHRTWMPAERHYKKYINKSFPEPSTLFNKNEYRGTAAKSAEMNILNHMHWTADSKIYPQVMNELDISPISERDSCIFNKTTSRFTPEQRSAWDAVYGPMNEKFKNQYPIMSDEDKMRWRYQRYMQDYLGCVAAVDENVGRVLDYLDENGLSENTIVVYTSDQGFYLGENGWFDKRFAYNESFRTPLLIRWPNVIKPGIECKELVQNLDFAQTFLKIADVQTPENMQGESLIPLFKQDTINWTRDAVYYHYYQYPSQHMVKRHYAIVTKEFKLIHFYYDVDEWELYDLKNDSLELNNLINEPVYAHIADSLKTKLLELRTYYKDNDELDKCFIMNYLKDVTNNHN